MLTSYIKANILVIIPLIFNYNFFFWQWEAGDNLYVSVHPWGTDEQILVVVYCGLLYGTQTPGFHKDFI